MLNRTNILILTIILIAFNALFVKAQDTAGLECRAMIYFHDKILKVDEKLHDTRIKFPDQTQENPSSVYYLSYALREINMIKDSIPGRPYLDSIESANNRDTLLHVKKRCPISVHNYKGSSNGIKYEMYVYNSIPYKGDRYVEILLLNRKFGREVYVFVKFINQEAVSYFKKSLLYD